MPFFLGALYTPPIVLAINVLLLVVLASGVMCALRAFFGVEGESAAILSLFGAAALMAIAMGAGYRLWQRIRCLGAVPLTQHPGGRSASTWSLGVKAWNLKRLAERGVPVSPGMVAPVRSLADSHLDRLARQIARFSKRMAIEKLILRSSFAEEDAELLCPGVFESVRDVSSSDVDAISRALKRVVRSREHDEIERFCRAAGRPKSAVTPPSTVLVQEQIHHETWGVISSFDPETRRLDQVYVEIFDDDGKKQAAGCYQAIFGRWDRQERYGLSGTQAVSLIEALFEAERLLQGPVALEFGSFGNKVVIYQARRMPEVEMSRVWTNSGVAQLNPDALPPFLADLAYGPELGFLDKMLWRDQRVTTTGPRDEKLRLLHGRPYIAYEAYARASRFGHLTKRSLLFPLHKLFEEWHLFGKINRLREPPREVLDELQAALRQSLELQNRCQIQAQLWMGWRDALQLRLAREQRDPPLVPWPSWLHQWLVRRAEMLHRLRTDLHERVLALLARAESAAVARVGELLTKELSDAVVQMTQEELEGSAKAGRLLVSEETLSARKLSFDKHRRGSAHPLFIESSTGLKPAPAFPESTSPRLEKKGTGKSIRARSLVAGTVEGLAVTAREGLRAPTDGNYVLIALDSSTRWLPYVAEAAGAVLVGGGLLSHLGLQLIELGSPTLFGITPEEAASLEGRTIRLDGKRGLIEVLDSGPR